MNKKLTARLKEMLSYCRPMGSRTETAFCVRYLVPLGCTQDRHGNWHREIGPPEIASRVLWSCHTDTVHDKGGTQRVIEDRGLLFLPPRSKSSCLGADDTAGVFLMTEMIARNVPGRYVFHYGEERGCVGSDALVREAPAWLADIKIAIALDRKGTTT